MNILAPLRTDKNYFIDTNINLTLFCNHHCISLGWMHGIDAHCPTDIVTAGCSKLRLVKSLYRPKVIPENVEYLNLKYLLWPIKHSKIKSRGTG